MMKRLTRHIAYGLSGLALLTLTAFLTAACTSDTPDDTPGDNEIRFIADVWQVMEGTRATTYDNVAAIQADKFKCYAYVDGSTDLYINGSNVSYSSVTTPNWTFDDGKHYWPASGVLNFFAFMPHDLANTCCTFDPTAYAAGTNDDGYSEDNPRIVCTSLPVTSAGQSTLKELVYAYKPAQSKAGQGSTGVTLNFMHPFARIYFKMSAASGTNVTINSITIADVYNNGTCTLNGAAPPQTSTWATSGDVTSFVSNDEIASSAVTTGPYLVIPNNYGSNTFTVNATWDDWSNLTTNVSATVTVDWRPGYSYTYTFTLSKYALKVDATKFTEQW